MRAKSDGARIHSRTRRSRGLHAYIHIKGQFDAGPTLCNHCFFEDFRRLYARMHALVYRHTPPRFCAIRMVKKLSIGGPAFLLAEALCAMVGHRSPLANQIFGLTSGIFVLYMFFPARVCPVCRCDLKSAYVTQFCRSVLADGRAVGSAPLSQH